MINVIASIHVKEGKVQEFIDILKANVPAVLKEKGCIEYVPAVDIKTDIPPQELDKNIVYILEKWETMDDLKTHFSAPHMFEYKEKVKDLVSNVTLKILGEA